MATMLGWQAIGGKPGERQSGGPVEAWLAATFRKRLILSALDPAGEVRVMNQATSRLHPLKGDRKGMWAVTVRVNWRVSFRFENGDACDVDLEDYH